MFEKKLKELGIMYKNIEPYTPKQNGKVERSHRKDQERFYYGRKFYSLEDLRNQGRHWLKEYNLAGFYIIDAGLYGNEYLTSLINELVNMGIEMDIKKDSITIYGNNTFEKAKRKIVLKRKIFPLVENKAIKNQNKPQICE